MAVFILRKVFTGVCEGGASAMESVRVVEMGLSWLAKESVHGWGSGAYLLAVIADPSGDSYGRDSQSSSCSSPVSLENDELFPRKSREKQEQSVKQQRTS